jgi:hypothetical protein
MGKVAKVQIVSKFSTIQPIKGPILWTSYSASSHAVYVVYAVCCMLYAVCCMLYAVCCVCCMLCMLYAVCCVCCMLYRTLVYAVRYYAVRYYAVRYYAVCCMLYDTPSTCYSSTCNDWIGTVTIQLCTICQRTCFPIIWTCSLMCNPFAFKLVVDALLLTLQLLIDVVLMLWRHGACERGFYLFRKRHKSWHFVIRSHSLCRRHVLSQFFVRHHQSQSAPVKDYDGNGICSTCYCIHTYSTYCTWRTFIRVQVNAHLMRIRYD